MRRFFLIYMMAFIALPLFCRIPLSKAVKKGIELNLNLKNNSLEMNIIENRKKIAWAEKYFNIDLKGYYLFRSEKIEMKTPDMTISPGLVIPGMSLNGGAFNNYDASISVTQPIFTGNILTNSVKLKEVEKSLNQTSREIKIIEVSRRIRTSYFNYRLLKNEKKSLEILQSRIKVHLSRLKDLYMENLVSMNEILETELKAGEIELKTEEVRSLTNSVSIFFRELCGYDIAFIETGYSESMLNEADALEFFLINHPKLKIFSGKKKVLELNKKISRGKNLPHVSGFAEFHYGRPGINFFEDKWDSWFQGGFSFSYNIFNSGKYRKEKGIIMYEKEKLINLKKDLISKIKTKLSDMYQNYLSLKKRLEFSEKLILRSEDESGMKKKLFEENQVSNSEYLTSLLNVKKYRSMKNKIELQTELLKVNINSLIGREGEK